MFFLKIIVDLNEIYKAVTDVPESSIASIPLAWVGWLQSTSSSASLYVNDANLFDGAPPVLMVYAQSTPSSLDLSQFLNMVADPAKRFGVLDAVPSTYFGDTLRDKFLNGSWLAVDRSVSGSILLLSNSSSSSVSGTYISMSGSCNSTSCSPSMSKSLERFASGGALKGYCQSFSIVESSLVSNTSADFFVTKGQSSVMLRSFSTFTQALFRCTQGDNATFIGLSMSTEVFSESLWPFMPFATDSQAAGGMLQNMPLKAQGFIWGSVESDGKMYSLARSDIFSAHGGGALIADQFIGKSGNDTKAAVGQIQTIFGSICSLLSSDITPLNTSVSSLFAVNENTAGKLLHTYQSVAPNPSIVGFLQWFVAGTEGQVDIYLSGEQTVLVVNVSATAKYKEDSSALSNSTASFHQISTSFDDLVAQVQNKYPGINNYTAPILSKAKITGYHAIWLTASIIITQPLTGNNTFNVSLGHSTMSEVSYFDAKFSNGFHIFEKLWFSEASIAYEHGNVDIEATVASTLKDKLGTTIGLSTDNRLVLSSTPGPSSALIASSFLDIAANLSDISTENANVYINYNIASVCGDVTWYQAMMGCSQIDFGDNKNPSPFELRDAVVDYLSTLCSATNTTVVVTLQAPRDSSYIISIVTSAVQDMSLSSVGNPWEQIIDTSRLVMPVGTFLLLFLLLLLEFLNVTIILSLFSFLSCNTFLLFY